MPLPGGGARGDTLLARTFVRAVALPEVGGLITITNRDYYFDTRDAYACSGRVASAASRLPARAVRAQHRAAVALGALYAEAIFGPDTTLLVLPADHLIRDAAAFASAVSRAAELARDGWLVTFGIAPTSPETGYGYLELGDALCRSPDTFRGSPLHRETAARRRATLSCRRTPPLEFGHVLLRRGDRARSVRATRAGAARRSARRCGRRCVPRRPGPMLEIDAALFAAVPEISFDVAVMEQRREGRGRPRRVRLERCRLVARGRRSRRAGRRRQPRRRRARRHRHSRYLRARGRSRRRDRRRGRTVRRRDARCRARRAPRSPATREGSRRRAQGARPRRLPHPQDRAAAVGRLHRAAGRARLQDQAHRGEAGRGAVAAAPPPAQRALGRRRRRGARHQRRSQLHAADRTNRRSSR